MIDGIGVDAVKKMFADAGVRAGGWGLPVEWRQSEEKWRGDLEGLGRAAKACAAIGAWRCFTWVMPASNERAMDENWQFHIERFKPIAKVLAEHGCRLGLEFIGPKTIRDSHKYPFVWKMKGMLKLARLVGPNVGLLVDCWHWYTSHGTVEELRGLKADDVVYVHVNDAPVGVEVDRQIDNVRELPGATGVVDIAGFLKALKEIGYDGPVTPEPFKDELKTLASDQERLRVVGEGMQKIWRVAGLG